MLTTEPTLAPAIRAPRGTALSCQGWHQEAALRMLMNNLDPEVAERPDDLVVYGGSGKAARNPPPVSRISGASTLTGMPDPSRCVTIWSAR